LVLTGAKAALGSLPGMIGYGSAKAPTHIRQNILASAQAFSILSVTFDAPINRK